MFVPLSFVWGWVFHLVWVWTVHGADWVSLMVAATVSCAFALLRPVIEAFVWHEVGSYAGKVADVARALVGQGADGLAKEPAMGVMATLLGWFIVQVAVMASDDVVVKVILLSVAVVAVLATVLLQPLLGRRHGGGGDGGGDKGYDLGSVALPKDRGKLKFVLDV